MPRSYITLLTNNGPCSSVRKHEILEEGSAKGIRNGNGNAPRRNNTETNVKRKNVYRKGKSLERLEQNHEDDAKVEPDMSDSRRYSSIFRGIWQQFLPRKEELARLYRQFGAPHDPSKPFCILAETLFGWVCYRWYVTGTRCRAHARRRSLLDTGEKARSSDWK